MIEDEILKWRFKSGSTAALSRIYEKYLDFLLTLAIALLNDVNTAEDVVHDVFVSFAQSAQNFKVAGSLRHYLAVCTINRARDHLRTARHRPRSLDYADSVCSQSSGPDHSVISSDQSQQVNLALARLPDDQREAIVLHLKGGLTFRQIARLQDTSVNTIQGRYRYGLNKLRQSLNGEVTEK